MSIRRVVIVMQDAGMLNLGNCIPNIQFYYLEFQ
jgi:hypothetical protein